MTFSEFNSLEFRLLGHLSLRDEHCTTYASCGGRLGFCDHVKLRSDGSCGRSYRHWRIDKKVYKTKESFIAALEEFSPNVVSIR